MAGAGDHAERAGLDRSSRAQSFGPEDAVVAAAPIHVEMNYRYADFFQRAFWLRILRPAAVVLAAV